MLTLRGVAKLTLAGLFACSGNQDARPQNARPTVANKEVAVGDHAVLVEFQLSKANAQGLDDLEDELRAAIESAKAGEFDGNELSVDGSGQGKLFMYGPDADRLFDVVRPILEASPLMKGATIIRRYGPPSDGVKETRMELGPSKD